MIAPDNLEKASENCIIAHGNGFVPCKEFYGLVPCFSLYDVKQVVKFAKSRPDREIIIHGVNKIFVNFFVDEKLPNIQIPINWYEKEDFVIVLNETIANKINAGGTAKAVVSEVLTYIGINFGEISDLPKLKRLLNKEHFKTVNPEISKIFTEFEEGLKVYEPTVIVNDIRILFSFHKEKIKAEFPAAYDFISKNIVPLSQ